MRGAVRLLPLFLVLAMLLSACAVSPDKTVGKFMEATKALDKDEMTKYVVLEEGKSLDSDFKTDDPTGAEILKTVFGRMTYEVGEATVDGDKATVPVEITCVNMAIITTDIMSKIMGLAMATALDDEEEGNEALNDLTEQMFMSALVDPNAVMTTQSVSLPLKKTDGKWLIAWDAESSEAFMNAATGNLGKLSKIFGEDENDTP